MARQYRGIGAPERFNCADAINTAIAAATGDAVGFYAGGPLDLVAAFLVYGALSGLALGYLLRTPRPTSAQVAEGL